MNDIIFSCPKCRQSINAPFDMAGQLIDCPTCKHTFEIPAKGSAPVVDHKLQPLRQKTTAHSSQSFHQAHSRESPTNAKALFLLKILVTVFTIAFIVSLFFILSFWKENKKITAEAEHDKVVAQNAIAEAHAKTREQTDKNNMLTSENNQLKQEIKRLSNEIERLVPSARKDLIKRDSFMIRAKGLSKEQVIEYVGRPESTREQDDDPDGIWWYDSIVYDPITGKADRHTTLFFDKWGNVRKIMSQ